MRNRLKNGESLRNIASYLSRNTSTISRELARNGTKPATTRVNVPSEIYLDSRHFRGATKVNKIRKRKDRYQKRLRRFNASRYLTRQAQEKSLERVKTQELRLNTPASPIYKQTTKDILDVFDEVKTTTYDNGIEFSRWSEIEKNLGATVYFANPCRSWE